jgi:hypothetical protein
MLNNKKAAEDGSPQAALIIMCETNSIHLLFKRQAVVFRVLMLLVRFRMKLFVIVLPWLISQAVFDD